MNTRIDKIVIYALFSILILLLACETAQKNGKLVKIIIHQQETASDVAIKLFDNGIIRSTKPFLFWARILGYDKKIKAGRYNFQANSDVFTVLKTLSQGGVSKALITIPEGYTIKEIAKLLENEGVCSKQDFIKACSDITLLNSLNINSKSAEGYLFPDSYDFAISANPREIIERMAKRFWQVLEESQNSKVKSQKYIDTIVTIASLIEKEAKLDSERPIIASVFYNRLKYKMPLQSCATVQYILPNHKEQLNIEDTKINSPYNTYLYPGLPPTPICNPGQASLIAAIYPAQTKYLYFAVDTNGSHYFSKSFSEHQAFLRSKER